MKAKLNKCEEEKDVGRIWKNVKGFLGSGGSSGALTELTDPQTGQQTNSPKNMANIQNQYYKEKVHNIREKLFTRGDPTAGLKKLMDERLHPRMQGLALRAVSPDQVSKIIQGLKNSKSCGLDN